LAKSRFFTLPNHVHLLVTAAHACAIAKMMQMLGSRYGYYINKTEKKFGDRATWSCSSTPANFRSDP
jgi:REP element-mobilizing transposase RayT